MKKQFQTTAVYRGVLVHLALMSAGGVAFAQAQSADDQPAAKAETVVVKGQRAALQSAQKIKQNSEESVDSVVAEEAGKLPDKSITEVLQRVVGVNVERVRSTNNDPKHFSEGSDDRITVRGLSWGSSTLNGREIFSAGWPGRDLSWSAVPSELMAGVDVYKNPSAEKIEGAVAGQIDLRTWLPFDFAGTRRVISVGSNFEERTKRTAPTVSALFSTRWENDLGHWGALADLAMNHSTYEQQHLDVAAYYPRNDVVAGKTVWAPAAASWGQNVGSSDRQGFYGALQWKKNDMQSSLTAFISKSLEENTGSNIYPSFSDGNFNASPYNSTIDNVVLDSRNVVVSGHYSYPLRPRVDPNDPTKILNMAELGKGAAQFADGGISMGTSRAFNQHHTNTSELAWNFKWNVNDRFAVQNDLQWVNSNFQTRGEEIQTATFVPSMDITTNGNNPVQIGFDDKTRAFLADPGNYYWLSVMPGRYKGDANLYAWKTDGKFIFDHPVLRDLRFGFRTTYRNSKRDVASYKGDPKGAGWQSVAVPWEVVQTRTPGQLGDGTDNGGWQSRANFGYLSDPRYAIVPVELYNYSAFGGNKPPSVVFPTYGALQDYGNYAKLLHDVRRAQCEDGVKWAQDWNAAHPTQTIGVPSCNKPDYSFDTALLYGQHPNNTSSTSERTHAAYTNLRFGFDDWKIPVEGNIGVRLVYTARASHGHTTFNPKYTSQTPPSAPQFAPIGGDPDNGIYDHSGDLDVTGSHVDVLPSLNLKFNLTGDNKLLGRIGMARSVYRPGFNQLQESVKLEQKIDNVNKQITYVGENSGNAKLKPLTSDNLDVGLEWYPRSGQMLTATAFYKDVKDIIYKSAYTRDYMSLGGNPQTFLITGPRNSASAQVWGLELKAETYLDSIDLLKSKLPDWAYGFGVSADYTYLGSRQKFYRDAQVDYCPANGTITSDALKVYGCDTNGMPFGSLPLPGLVKNTANFALRYDRYGFSARLAYNWTTRVLKTIGNDGTTGQNGTSADPMRAGMRDTWYGLPGYQEAFGQWDGSLSYDFTDKFNLSFSVTNLNNVTVRYTNQQTPGAMGSSWGFPGRSYNLAARYEF